MDTATKIKAYEAALKAAREWPDDVLCADNWYADGSGCDNTVIRVEGG